MSETSFPIVGKDYANSQFAAIGRSVGSGILDQGGSPYAITLSDTDNTATLGVSSVDGVARAVVSGFGHLIDVPVSVSLPAVTSPTVYHVGLRYDPTKAAAAAGPVSIQVITGDTPTVPADGSRFVDLYRITRQASTVLSGSEVRSYMPRVAPSLWMPAKVDFLSIDYTKLLFGTTVYVADIATTFVLRESGGWLALGGSARTIATQAQGGKSLFQQNSGFVFLTSFDLTVDTAEQADITFQCLAGQATNWGGTFQVYLNSVPIAAQRYSNDSDGRAYKQVSIRTKATLRAGANNLAAYFSNERDSSDPVTTNVPQFLIWTA